MKKKLDDIIRALASVAGVEGNDEGSNHQKQDHKHCIRETGSAVRDRFEEFKYQTKEAFVNDTEGMLDMSRFTVRELVDLGYVHRKIESFMFASEFEKKDIDRFFHEECFVIDAQTLGPFELGSPQETVQIFIERLKCHTVTCKLWFEFVDFMSRLKNERIKLN